MLCLPLAHSHRLLSSAHAPPLTLTARSNVHCLCQTLLPLLLSMSCSAPPSLTSLRFGDHLVLRPSSDTQPHRRMARLSAPVDPRFEESAHRRPEFEDESRIPTSPPRLLAPMCGADADAAHVARGKSAERSYRFSFRRTESESFPRGRPRVARPHLAYVVEPSAGNQKAALRHSAPTPPCHAR